LQTHAVPEAEQVSLFLQPEPHVPPIPHPFGPQILPSHLGTHASTTHAWASQWVPGSHTPQASVIPHSVELPQTQPLSLQLFATQTSGRQMWLSQCFPAGQTSQSSGIPHSIPAPHCQPFPAQSFGTQTGTAQAPSALHLPGLPPERVQSLPSSAMQVPVAVHFWQAPQAGQQALAAMQVAPHSFGGLPALQTQPALVQV
jgi:hypothetical protein